MHKRLSIRQVGADLRDLPERWGRIPPTLLARADEVDRVAAQQARWATDQLTLRHNFGTVNPPCPSQCMPAPGLKVDLR
jgi:hypothetical protein